ncbi:MAG: FtsX-like permease family protein [Candidatus Thorarchaeota archaeon]
MMIGVSLRIVKKQKVRTIITILAIATSISLPLNVSVVTENASRNVIIELDNRGIDDISVIWNEFRPVTDVINEVEAIDNACIERFEPRIKAYSRITNEFTGSDRSCSFVASNDEDTWFNGLVIDNGTLPNDNLSIAIESKVASVLLLDVDDAIQIEIDALNITRAAVISGIFHEVGQPARMLCVASTSFINTTFDTNLTNYLGMKLKHHIPSGNQYVTEFASSIENKLTFATVITPKINHAQPVLKSLRDSRLFLTLLLCCSLISASAAIYSLMTISIYEVIHEVGILQAIGFSKNQIKRIFSYIPLIIAPLGILFSLILSMITSSLFVGLFINISSTIFLDMPYSIISEFGLASMSISPISFSITSLAVILIGFIVVFISGVYPCIRGVLATPRKALHPRTTKPKRNSHSIIFILLFSLYIVLNFFGRVLNIPSSFTFAIPILAVVSSISLMLYGLWFLVSLVLSKRSTCSFAESYGFTTTTVAVQSAKSNREHVQSNIVAISICILLVILSSTAATGIRYQQISNVYMRIGSDIQLSGIKNETVIESIEAIPDVDEQSIIHRSYLSYTFVDNISEISGTGSILSYFFSGPRYKETTRPEYTQNETVENALEVLSSNDSIVITTNLARYLGKTKGDLVSISFADTSETGFVTIFSMNATIGAIVDYLPGIPSKNPAIYLNYQIIESFRISQTYKVLIKLKNPSQYEVVLKEIAKLTDSFDYSCAEEELIAYEERFLSIYKLMNLVIIVTMIGILIIIGTSQVSRVITNQYVYGIMRFVGFSSLQMYHIIFLESLIPILLSFMGGLLASLVLYFPLILGEITNHPVVQIPLVTLSPIIPIPELLGVFGLCLCSTIIISVIAIAFLRKKNLVELIRDELQ